MGFPVQGSSVYLSQSNKINYLVKVASGFNLFDLVFPIPCIYLTTLPIQSIYFRKGILIRNTLSITKVPSPPGAKFPMV